MASSFLSAFGVTPAAPPASAYSDQAAETANLTNAKSQLASVTSSLGLALTAAKLAGVNTTNLDNLNSEATSLSNANLTSAQLQAKVTALNSKLGTAKATQDAQRKADAIAAMQKAVSTVQGRVAVISADNTTSPGLKNQYNDLLKSAKTDLNTIKTITDLSGGEPTPDTTLSQLDTLDAAKETEENKTFSWSRFWKNLTIQAMFYGTIVSVSIGFLLGGIIMSNVYASDSFWGIKLFYFVYGAIFFPLSIIYGAVKAPYWVSGIFPLYSLDSPTPAVQTGGFNLPSLPALPKLPALSSLTSKVTASAIPSVSSLIGQVQSQIQPPVEPPPAPVPVPAPAPVVNPTQPVAPAPKRSAFATLFGYSLVDPNTPTASQTYSKNLLRYLAIAELVCLSTSAIYYGVDSMIMKNMIKV